MVMQKEQISELFEKFENACYLYQDIECWSARELQGILGYSKWENFEKVLIKAKESCANTQISIEDHFRDIPLNPELENQVSDMALTRYACYLVVQNGEPTKTQIAFAQTYFAVQTRKQEIIEKRLLDVARISAREKLTKSEKKLSGIIYERGVSEMSFAHIRSRGDKALFGGFNTQEMKKRLSIADNKPLADFLPTLTLKAKDFATELTSHNVIEKDLHGEENISKEHIENNYAVRRMLLERGVKPETLPALEDASKVKKRLESDENELLKQIRKIKKKSK